MGIGHYIGKCFTAPCKMTYHCVRTVLAGILYTKEIPIDMLKAFGVAEMVEIGYAGMEDISKEQRPYAIALLYSIATVATTMTLGHLLIKIAAEKQPSKNGKKIFATNKTKHIQIESDTYHDTTQPEIFTEQASKIKSTIKYLSSIRETLLRFAYESDKMAIRLRDKTLNFALNYSIFTSFLYNTFTKLLKLPSYAAIPLSLILALPIPAFFALVNGNHTASVKETAQDVAHTYAPHMINAPKKDIETKLIFDKLIKRYPKTQRIIAPILNEQQRVKTAIGQVFEAGTDGSAFLRIVTIMFRINPFISAAATLTSWVILCITVPFMSGLTNRIPPRYAVENGSREDIARKTAYSVIANMPISAVIKGGQTTLIIFMGLMWNYTAIFHTYEIDNWIIEVFAAIALGLGGLDLYQTAFSARKIVSALYNIAHNQPLEQEFSLIGHIKRSLSNTTFYLLGILSATSNKACKPTTQILDVEAEYDGKSQELRDIGGLKPNGDDSGNNSAPLVLPTNPSDNSSPQRSSESSTAGSTTTPTYIPPPPTLTSPSAPN